MALHLELRARHRRSARMLCHPIATNEPVFPPSKSTCHSTDSLRIELVVRVEPASPSAGFWRSAEFCCDERLSAGRGWNSPKIRIVLQLLLQDYSLKYLKSFFNRTIPEQQRASSGCSSGCRLCFCARCPAWPGDQSC
jgi:hypothetical protein